MLLSSYVLSMIELSSTSGLKAFECLEPLYEFMVFTEHRALELDVKGHIHLQSGEASPISILVNTGM